MAEEYSDNSYTTNVAYQKHGSSTKKTFLTSLKILFYKRHKKLQISKTHIVLYKQYIYIKQKAI